MLRSAPRLRRGALLIRGPSCTTKVWVPALRSSAKSAAPRPGHGEPSPPHPFRRALFGKRLRPFDIILRGHHCLHRRILALLGHRLLQRDPKALLDRLLRGADRHRAVLANRLGPALRRRERLTLRHHLTDKTELVALACADVARGQD